MGLPSSTLLLEDAQIGGAFNGPGRGRLHLSRQIEVADLVGSGLRRRISRSPIILQQLDRHGRRGTELVVGEPHIEMEFADVVPVADVAVETANVGGREIAETVVMQALERAIDGVIVDLLAPLRRPLDAAERTAHGVDLGALIGKTVLHLDDDRAAQRVETEGWIVGYNVYPT